MRSPARPRATTVQKCFRTVDIEVIGTTACHFTFFEMLGNFSFGDYFKAEAIPYAWELFTEVLGIDGDRLWVTVHDCDDEAEQLWVDEVGVPPDRIQRLGDEDNFWKMGETGPCGRARRSSSTRRGLRADGGPDHGGDDRYVELWNLVFMQYDRDADGTLSRAAPQEHRHRRGAGAGAPILQGVESGVRHRPVRADRRRGGLDPGTGYGAERAHRRRASSPGRPRPCHLHARGRRRASVQREPWVRAAAASSAGQCSPPARPESRP